MTAFDHTAFLAGVTRRPGVYQMYGVEGSVLYVGKAKNLRNRLGSYFRASGLDTKTMALVARIRDIQVTVTASEAEALLLEHNLIKQHSPPYNILLRDDKSYPYVHLSDDPFPRLSLQRGAKRRKGRYFGPYPSANAVRDSLHFLQKVFQVRQCENSFFRNRSRPCLQHQIQRCTAPCVGLVAPEDYAEQVEQTSLFLQGKSQELMVRLADEMEQAAQALAYERAALLRDQLAQLQQVQQVQGIEGSQGDLDLVAVALEGGKACVQVIFVRGGRVLGSRSYYPPLRLNEDAAVVLSAFLPQFYLAQERDMPREIITSEALPDAEVMADAFGRASGRQVALRHRVRDARKRWLELAVRTAANNLQAVLSSQQAMSERLHSLQQALGLPAPPQRIECFDISHSSGEATVASCVVFDPQGARKSDYRRFNISGITGGDDYAAMAQALDRRFRRLLAGEGIQPDLLLIDGGKGQVSAVMAALAELGISDVEVVGVAKGITRKPGLETLIFGRDQRELQLPSDHPALHLIQQVRDEAHRFAITGHRQRRDKARTGSRLDALKGVGAKRRRELLRYFGGAGGVERASVDELAKVPGINQRLAQQIYEQLHDQ